MKIQSFTPTGFKYNIIGLWVVNFKHFSTKNVNFFVIKISTVYIFKLIVANT